MDTLEIVDNAIKELIAEYQVLKNYYFREREIHYIFYGKLSSLGELVHPEYPTQKRFKRIKGKKTDETYTEGIHSFDPHLKKGRTGSYDIVILNREFYNKYKNNLVKLASSKVDSNKDLNCEYIDIAIEFKYITGTFNLREVEYDIFKLKQASEVKHKKLIIFTRRRLTDKKYPDMIKTLEKIKNDEPGLHIEIIEDNPTSEL